MSTQFEDVAPGVTVPEASVDPPLPGNSRRPLKRSSRRAPFYLDPNGMMVQAPRPRGRVAFWLAVGWIALVVFVALFADLLPLRRFDIIIDNLEPRTAPRFSFTEPLGTDYLGRSTTSRLIYGARQSLQIGLYATLMAMSLGSIIGITIGYFRGKLDKVVSALLDSMISIPPLVTLLAIASVGQRNLTVLVLALGTVGTPTFVRLARANTLALAHRDYVTAARAMGAGHRRILFRELLPNVILPVSTYAFLFLAFVTVTEATISFLGLGVPPPTPSWGGMINNARPYLGDKPFLVFVPAACILFTVVAFTEIGDHARRRFDPRASALS